MPTSTSDAPCRILLISGSLRAASTNAAALRTADALAPQSVRLTIYAGLGDLPHFNPDDELNALPATAAALRAALGRADAVLFCTPEYAGSLPGSFKNLLDWCVGDGLYDKPVGWINASAQGAADGAHHTLRVVLGYVNADIVEEACVKIPVRRDAIGADGLIGDAQSRRAIGEVIAALAEHVVRKRMG